MLYRKASSEKNVLGFSLKLLTVKFVALAPRDSEKLSSVSIKQQQFFFSETLRLKVFRGKILILSRKKKTVSDF